MGKRWLCLCTAMTDDLTQKVCRQRPHAGSPRRLTPPGSMLAMLKQRFGETRAEPPRQCESIPYKGRFAIIGDVQPTSKVEFWRKSNAQERATHPTDHHGGPGLSGDCGRPCLLWFLSSELDRFRHTGYTPVRRMCTVFPLLGNHDYGIVRQAALRHFFTRFPHLERCHWLREPTGRWLIFLDSNASAASGTMA